MISRPVVVLRLTGARAPGSTSSGAGAAARFTPTPITRWDTPPRPSPWLSRRMPAILPPLTSTSFGAIFSVTSAAATPTARNVVGKGQRHHEGAKREPPDGPPAGRHQERGREIARRHGPTRRRGGRVRPSEQEQASIPAPARRLRRDARPRPWLLGGGGGGGGGSVWARVPAAHALGPGAHLSAAASLRRRRRALRSRIGSPRPAP